MYTSPKVDVSGKLHRCFHRRSTGQTARFMTFVANQLVRLFGAHFYLALTSPPTSWLGCSVLDSSPTNWSDRSSLHRQLSWGLLGVWIVRRFIVSHAEGSPAKLGTPRCLDSSYKSHQLSWGLPWRSDLATSHRCAIKLLHAIWIRVLILGSTVGS